MTISESTASCLQGLTNQYSITTHNLANASTAGFKRRRTIFSQELNDQLSVGAEEAVGSTSLVTQISLDWTQGALQRTGRPLDCAITGEGFFMLETPEGPLYSRNGVFAVNENGRLVDLLGRTVAGANGPITVPATASTANITIAGDGTLLVDGKSFGKLKVVSFADLKSLVPVGTNTYRAPDRMPAENAENAIVTQGFQESSNVNVVNELVDLLTVARMYESNFQAINKHDEKLGSLMDVLSQ